MGLPCKAICDAIIALKHDEMMKMTLAWPDGAVESLVREPSAPADLTGHPSNAMWAALVSTCLRIVNGLPTAPAAAAESTTRGTAPEASTSAPS